jgi:SAM-dependent methyltransferase
MPELLFDRAAEYEAMLNQGISLSGEGQEFFIAGRIRDMQSRVSPNTRRILDFGCGTGKTCAYLSEAFPEACVVGTDTSELALRHATASFGSARIQFASPEDLTGMEPFDLCYVNGVFHHIQPADRQRALASIRELLSPGGFLSLFENNPWNPGTRIVMRRIPFDRDAITLAYPEVQRRLREAGFDVRSTRFIFFFPRLLGWVRFTEPWLAGVPLGAQYCVIASRPVT